MIDKQFGTKYTCQDLILTNELADIYRIFHKELDIQLLMHEYTLQNTKYSNELHAHLTAMQGLDHIYLDSIVDSISLDGGTKLCVIYDLHDHGSLLQVISSYTEQRIPINESMVWEIGAQIISALRYLHGHSCATKKGLPYIHGNLRPSNVLVTDSSKLILTGYGFSLNDPRIRHLCEANWQYAAPEILSSQSPAEYMPHSDMFSLGLILLEICTGTPVSCQHKEDALDALNNLQLPLSIDGYSIDLLEFIKRLLQMDPSRRITAAEAASHPSISEGLNRVSTSRHCSLETVITLEDLQSTEQNDDSQRVSKDLMPTSSSLIPSSEDRPDEIAHLMNLIAGDNLEELLVCQQFNNDCFAQHQRVTNYLKVPEVIRRLLTLAFIPIEQRLEEPSKTKSTLIMHPLQNEAISVIQECGYGTVVLESLLLFPHFLDIPFKMLASFVEEHEAGTPSRLFIYNKYDTILSSFNKLIISIISSPSRLPGLFSALSGENTSRMDLWIRGIANPHVNEALRKLLLDHECRRNLTYKQLDAFAEASDLIGRLLKYLTNTDSLEAYSSLESAAHILLQILTAKVPFLCLRVLAGVEPVIERVLSPAMNTPEAYPRLLILLDFIICVTSFVICGSTIICLKSYQGISEMLLNTNKTGIDSDMLLSCLADTDWAEMELFLRVFSAIEDLLPKIESLISVISNPIINYLWIDFVARLLQITDDVRTEIYRHKNNCLPSDGVDSASFNVPYAYGLKPIGYGMLLGPNSATRSAASGTRNTIGLEDTFLLDNGTVISVSVYTLCKKLTETDLLYLFAQLAATNPSFTIYHVRFVKVVYLVFEYGSIDFQILDNGLKRSRLFGFYEAASNQYLQNQQKHLPMDKMHCSFFCHLVFFLRQVMKLATLGSQYKQTGEEKPERFPKSIMDLKSLLAKAGGGNTNKLGQLLASSNFLDRFSSILLSK